MNDQEGEGTEWLNPCTEDGSNSKGDKVFCPATGFSREDKVSGSFQFELFNRGWVLQTSQCMVMLMGVLTLVGVITISIVKMKTTSDEDAENVLPINSDATRCDQGSVKKQSSSNDANLEDIIEISVDDKVKKLNKVGEVLDYKLPGKYGKGVD
ncbi:hypothetical protein FRX31_026799 [Thalictrum thalictroides]|uniref:Uncharacterized protein n=1 Tax=Thalictrum thalictroides TaxID=46969 RepID=A0A7J6VEU3_THATH|nr:hypothetical protein FRX31_026799 [Thalictrum thalictroides]